MESKILQLEGVQRNAPNNTVKDGACQEIINARFKDGAWRPIGSKKKKFNFSVAVTNIFYHQINPDYFTYVYQTGNTVRARIYVEGGYENDQLIKDYAAVKTLKFSNQGAILIINNITDNQLETAQFDTNDEDYTYIGSLLPDIPWIEVIAEDTATYKEWSYETYTENMEVAKPAAFAKYLTLNSELMKDGYFTGYSIISYAYELYDGSFVHHSTPIIMEHGESLMAFFDIPEPMGKMLLGKIKKYKNKIKVRESNTLCNIVKLNYKNLIKGIRFFMVNPCQMYMDCPETIPEEPDYHEMELDTNFSYTSLIEGRPDYYSCGFMPLDQLAQNFEMYIASGNLNDLATEKNMGVNSGDFHNICSDAIFDYNNRTFYGDINSKLYKGFTPEFFILPRPDYYSGTPYNMAIEVDLKTAEGIKTVRSDWKSFDFWTTYGNQRGYMPSEYIAYPDSRAVAFRIIADYSGSYHLTLSHPLLSHPYLNLSYYRKEDAESSLEQNWTGTTLQAIVNTLKDSNRVQATKVNNPYNMPALYSYRVGSRSVIGFGASAIPISEGQFGQYPLIAFCSDGIWSLNISNDPEILIDSITPLNNRVCNNPNGIITVLNSIVFTTEEGLFALTGREDGEIAEVIEGSIASPLDDCLDYTNWIDDPNHYEVTDFISSVPFTTYLASAKMAHDTLNQELIISNPTYKYSYVYSLKYNLWYKISESFNSFMQNYPDVSGYKTGVAGNYYGLYSLIEEENTYPPVHILTRPIKLQPGFKRIDTAFLRGYAHMKAGKGFGFLLFGSLDGQEYYLLNGRKPLGEMLDIELRHTTMTCRYFIIVAGGLCDEDSFITHFELIYDGRFQTKLR